MSQGTTETWTVNVRGDAAKRISDISEELETSRKSWGENAEAVNKLRGGLNELTDQFKVFGKRGNEIATLLEEMPDPIARARLAQSLLGKEMARSGSLMGKAEGALAGMRVRLAAMPAAYKMMAAGAAAAGAAVFALAFKAGQLGVKAWKAYAQSSERATKALDSIEDSTTRTEKSLGSTIERATHATDAVGGLSLVYEDAAGSIDKLSDSMGDSTKVAEGFWSAILMDRTGLGAKELLKVGAAANDARVELDRFADRLGDVSPDAERAFAAMMKLRNAEVELLGSTDLLGDEVDALAGSFKNFERDANIGRTNAALEEMIGNMERLRAGISKADAPKAGGGGKPKETARFLDGVKKAVQDFEGSLDPGLIGPGTKGLLDRYLLGDEEPDIEGVREQWAKIAEELDRAFAGPTGGSSGITAAQQDFIDSTAAMVAPWQSASDQIVAGFVNIGASAVAMGTAVAMGKASLGDMGSAFLGSMGALFEQVGTGIMLSGLALEALFVGSPGAAILFGGALAVAGAAMSGLAAPGGPAGAAASSSAGTELRDIARDFRRPEDDTSTGERTIIVQIGTREISREIRDMNRRGLT